MWHGKRLEKVHICRYSGYPLGVDVSNAQLIDRVLIRVRKMIDYWKAADE